MSLTEQPRTPEVLRKIMARDLPREVTVPNLTSNAYAPPEERHRLAALEEELSRSPLDEIAARLRTLNFGEMHELAEGIEGDPKKIWDWSVQRKAQNLAGKVSHG